MIYIGIDPGVKTGFAVWDSESRSYVRIDTLDFWGTYDGVIYEYYPSDALPVIVIEDPSQNRPTFDKGERGARRREKISQNVGANKREGQLLADRFESLGFEVRRVRPAKGTGSKMNAPAFSRLTGFTGRTSQHGRDAAMLVYEL